MELLQCVRVCKEWRAVIERNSIIVWAPAVRRLQRRSHNIPQDSWGNYLLLIASEGDNSHGFPAFERFIDLQGKSDVHDAKLLLDMSTVIQPLAAYHSIDDMDILCGLEVYLVRKTDGRSCRLSCGGSASDNGYSMREADFGALCGVEVKDIDDPSEPDGVMVTLFMPLGVGALPPRVLRYLCYPEDGQQHERETYAVNALLEVPQHSAEWKLRFELRNPHAFFDGESVEVVHLASEVVGDDSIPLKVRDAASVLPLLDWQS